MPLAHLFILKVSFKGVYVSEFAHHCARELDAPELPFKHTKGLSVTGDVHLRCYDFRNHPEHCGSTRETHIVTPLDPGRGARCLNLEQSESLIARPFLYFAQISLSYR